MLGSNLNKNHAQLDNLLSGIDAIDAIPAKDGYDLVNGMF